MKFLLSIGLHTAQFIPLAFKIYGNWCIDMEYNDILLTFRIPQP